jgi:histidine triad (HIT) family protein
MKKEDCIFCRIANGEIPSDTVYEDDCFRVILDLNPANPGHALILPKEHFADITELAEPYLSRVLALAAKIGQAQMKALGCDGFNVVQNNGEAAGQTVRHFHVHVIPRKREETEKIVTWTPHESDPAQQKKIAEAIRAAL